mgnify:FL=1
MFDKYQKKEMPLTGLISLGGGVGGLGVTGKKSGEIQQLKVIHSSGLQEDISQLSSYSFQDGDIIEPILGDYSVVIKCGGQAGGSRIESHPNLPQSGLGAWVQGTINMRYGAKYCIRINTGIGAIYWGEINTDNDYCMMLGAQGGDGKPVFAGFFDSRFNFSKFPNANGLGGNAGICNSVGNSTGSAGQGSPGIDGPGGSINATGGTGGTTTGYLTGSGGTKGTATNPNSGGSLQNNTDGGFFSKGTAVFSGGDSDGGSGGMGYFGGGAGGGVFQGSGPAPRTGGGGGGGSSYGRGVPASALPNPDLDDATVTNLSSALNTGSTIDTAFVTCVSVAEPVEKEERYWEGFEYGGAVITFGSNDPGFIDSPYDSRARTGLQYGFYTRTGAPAVESGDFGFDGIREREIIWDGVLVHNTGRGTGTSGGSTPTNANGWVLGVINAETSASNADKTTLDGYAYSWVDIIVKNFPLSSSPVLSPGITSSGQNGPPGSYYPWDGDQCNCFNVMRVEARYAELYTADEVRALVIQRRLSFITGTAPNDKYPLSFTSKDPF